ncbi:MAG: hypothetical protein BLM47_11375 [Candidatus Reconcilbacillus cellulovorans]|mgnify:FL=1|uniref:Uncharacterized protein n=1 Tax=Candidatus Reconcilbacillus cellulovorans TaxID=1906605 RepID=A0A2A6DYR2_9BACL|nr:MAG: hypothetical protein BLM47_11375 [Candidatus Reconcilbacillus cellulovorans]
MIIKRWVIAFCAVVGSIALWPGRDLSAEVRFLDAPFEPYVIRTLDVQDLYAADREDSRTSAKIAPQRVTVLDVSSNGFMKIQTWLGERWIKPERYVEWVDEDYRLLREVSVHGEDGAMVGMIAPQTVHVYEKTMPGPFHEYLIDTWLGRKWIQPGRASMQWTGRAVREERTIHVIGDVTLYEYPEQQIIGGYPVLHGKSYWTTLQSFERWRDWYHVHTPEGDYWIRPGIAFFGEFQAVNKRVTVTATKDLYFWPLAEGRTGFARLAPQTVTVRGQIENWYFIETWMGMMWIDRSNVTEGAVVSPPPSR